MDLCKYKDILGVPGKGLHQYFGFGFAILDLIGTIVIAYGLSLMFGQSFLKAFIALMIFTIIIHKLFCVKTKLNVFLGL